MTPLTNHYQDNSAITQSELHLFILWEYSRHLEQEILAEISQGAEIVLVQPIVWSSQKVAENFSRFYGIKLPDNAAKIRECGRGEFLLVVVNDHQPNYALRNTTRGEATVNINIFDLKEKFRTQTGGGSKIHATNSTTESRRDLFLLLGKTYEDIQDTYCKTPSKTKQDVLVQDIIGAKKWINLSQVFLALNNCSDYVVLRNFECLPENYAMENHGDIDILVERSEEAALLLNAKKVFNDPHRRHYEVRISGSMIPFDIREIGDFYYDENLEKRMLKERVLAKNLFYRPSDSVYFYTLAYHALIHKKSISIDYRERLTSLSSDINKKISFDSVSFEKDLLDLLVDFFSENGYRFTRPIDKSVFFNAGILGRNHHVLYPPKDPLNIADFLDIGINGSLLKVYLVKKLPKNIIRIKIRLSGIFRLDICIGKLKDL